MKLGEKEYIASNLTQEKILIVLTEDKMRVKQLT